VATSSASSLVTEPGVGGYKEFEGREEGGREEGGRRRVGRNIPV